MSVRCKTDKRQLVQGTYENSETSYPIGCDKNT